MDRERLADSVLSVIETFAALAACVGVCLLVGIAVMLLWAPPTWTVEIPLQPSGPAAESAPDVARRVSLLDLSSGVEVMTAQGGAFLVLTGLPSRRFPVAEISEALAAAGYGPPGDYRFTPSLDTATTLRKVAVPYLAVQALVFILVGWVLARFRVRSDPARRRVPFALAVPAGLGAGLGAFLASMLIAGTLARLGLPVTEQQWVLDLLGDRGQLVRLVPWIVLVVPISEEVFFRGYMFRRIAQHAGTAAGMAISSLTFALVHFNVSGFPVYVAIGLILAWVYRRTGNLAAPIAGHVIHNAIVLFSGVYFSTT